MDIALNSNSAVAAKPWHAPWRLAESLRIASGELTSVVYDDVGSTT